MDFSKIKPSELADMAANVLTLLGGTELVSIDEHVRADLVTEIGTMPTQLASLTAAAAVADGDKKAAFSDKNDLAETVSELMRRVRDLLKAGRASKSEFDQCGFDYPVVRSGFYIAQTPTEASAQGFSNGVNRLKFLGNNKGASVMYEIWRREGDDGVWHQHALTKRQSWEESGVSPGQYYEYRVRAVAARTVSNFSNSAVVYGVL